VTSFTDDFNRADSSDLGAGWVEVSGDWSIVSSQLSPPTSAGTVVLRAATAMASSDHYAQVTFSTVSAVSQGVWCRGNSGITTGYLWRNDGTSWDLFSVVSSTFTVIGTFAGAAAPGDVAKIQAVGSTIKGFVNGIQRVSVTDGAVTTGTSVGIRSATPSGIRYDDFTAADVTAGATLSTATAVETAQPLAGSKTATLGPATATEAAQPVTGTKTATLGIAAATDAAQALTGGKATLLDTAGAAETAQPLAGSKTGPLSLAVETTTAQALTGTKTVLLPAAAQTETAQPLTAVVNGSLSAAASVEMAQQLVGAKSATLAPAVETDTARPLTPDGGADPDIDITVGAPYSAWAADEPQSGRWEVAAPW